jgi:hypothetical protein
MNVFFMYTSMKMINSEIHFTSIADYGNKYKSFLSTNFQLKCWEMLRIVESSIVFSTYRHKMFTKDYYLLAVTFVRIEIERITGGVFLWQM